MMAQMAGECFVDDGLLDRVAERAVALAADFNPLDTCNLLVGMRCRCVAVVTITPVLEFAKGVLLMEKLQTDRHPCGAGGICSF